MTIDHLCTCYYLIPRDCCHAVFFSFVVLVMLKIEKRKYSSVSFNTWYPVFSLEMQIYDCIEHIELYVSRELCFLLHSGYIIMQDIFDTNDEHVTCWELSSDERQNLTRWRLPNTLVKRDQDRFLFSEAKNEAALDVISLWSAGSWKTTSRCCGNELGVDVRVTSGRYRTTGRRVHTHGTWK